MTEEDLVTFFRSLSTRQRKEYDALAELDRRYGEDVQAESDDRKQESAS